MSPSTPTSAYNEMPSKAKRVYDANNGSPTVDFVIVGEAKQCLVALADSCIIVKPHVKVASAFEDRFTEFCYRDVTGVEFYKGFGWAFLEVSDPAHPGEFKGGSRGARKKNPYAAFNCLPQPAGLPQPPAETSQKIEELRRRIRRDSRVQTRASTAPPDSAGQLTKLGEPRDVGVVSPTKSDSMRATLTLARPTVRPGDEIRASLAVEQPDPELESIRLTLGYDYNYMRPEKVYSGLTGLIRWDWAFGSEHPHYCVVDEHMLTTEDLDPSGCLDVTFLVPEEGPPSFEHVGSCWHVSATLVRRRGTDLRLSADFTVLPQRLDEVLRSRPSSDDPSYGWLRRPARGDLSHFWWGFAGISDDESKCAPQDLHIAIADAPVAAGGTIEGSLQLKLDPLGFASGKPYQRHLKETSFTERARARKAAAADVSQVRVKSAEVGLQCWRWGHCKWGHLKPPEHNASTPPDRYAILERVVAISLPTSLEVKQAYEFPFALEVPTDDMLHFWQWYQKNPKYVVGNVLPTFYGNRCRERAAQSYSGQSNTYRLMDMQVDDILWRVVAAVYTDGPIAGYSGDAVLESMPSPLAVGEEVVIYVPGSEV